MSYTLINETGNNAHQTRENEMHSNMTAAEAQAHYEALIDERVAIDNHICEATGWDMGKSLFSIETNPVTSNREWIEVSDAINWLRG